MAISVLFRKIRESEGEVEYEILSKPNDPNPGRVVLPDSMTGLDLTGASKATRAVVRRVHQLRVAEGRWPDGGLIQS